MRRALLLTSVLLAACAASGGAMAQSTNGEGLRYLSWPGKAPAPRAAVQPGREAAPQPTRVAANAPLPLARLDAPAPTPVVPRNGLTPASAFYSPTPAPAPQPYAAPETPAPAPVRAEAPRPVPVVTPEPAQVQAPAPPPVTAPVTAVADAAVDPMAPRRDAPIFRLQRQAAAEVAPAPQPTEQAPAEGRRAEAASQPAQAPAMTQAALAPVQGARFYSVHRQAGRQPDAISTPQPIYLDALPVEMAQTPSSADLAQPDGPPALLRNSNGTVRAMPQTQADDLP